MGSLMQSTFLATHSSEKCWVVSLEPPGKVLPVALGVLCR